MHLKKDNVPDDLKHIKMWVCWRFEVIYYETIQQEDGSSKEVRRSRRPTAKELEGYANGTVKLAKMPKYAGSGYTRRVQGTKRDLAQLVSFGEAVKKAREHEFDGVGIALVGKHRLTILDLDGCLDDNGNIKRGHALARKAVKETYAEISPSGRGLRVIYPELLTTGKRNVMVSDTERVEVYCTTGFVTITGDQHEDSGDFDRSVGSEAMGPAVRDKLVSAIENSGGMRRSDSTPTDGPADFDDNMPRFLRNYSVEDLRELLEALPDKHREEDRGLWWRLCDAIYRQFPPEHDDHEAAKNVFFEWSAGGTGYDEAANERAWKACGHRKRTGGISTIYNYVMDALAEPNSPLIANKSRVKIRDKLRSWGMSPSREAMDNNKKLRDLNKLSKREASEGELEPPRLPEDDVDLEDIDPDDIRKDPPVKWSQASLSEFVSSRDAPPGVRRIVDGWIATKSVVLMSATGGGGKTTISVVLAMLLAGGMRFADKEPVSEEEDPLRSRGPMRTMYISAEEDFDEMKLRFWANLHGNDEFDLYTDVINENLSIFSFADADYQAMYRYNRFDRYDTHEFTEHFNIFESKINDAIEEGNPYKVVFIDNVSKVFSGEKSDEVSVSAFLGRMSAMCIANDMTIVMIGHDGKTNKDRSENETYLGSVAWDYTPRTRWSLRTGWIDEEDAENGGTTTKEVKVLTVSKNNLGKRGHGWLFHPSFTTDQSQREVFYMKMGATLEDASDPEVIRYTRQAKDGPGSGASRGDAPETTEQRQRSVIEEAILDLAEGGCKAYKGERAYLSARALHRAGDKDAFEPLTHYPSIRKEFGEDALTSNAKLKSLRSVLSSMISSGLIFEDGGKNGLLKPNPDEYPNHDLGETDFTDIENDNEPVPEAPKRKKKVS